LDVILTHEPAVRLGIFFSVLGVMALTEVLWPARPALLPRRYRWTNNWALVGANTLVLRLLAPAGAVGIGLVVESSGIGLLQVLQPPLWLTILISVTLLDLVIWAQHRVFHAVPALWRIHRMHHTDLHFDVTTGLRFHPLEILLSFALKAMVILAFGVPAVAVLVFEVILSSLALFNHANVRLPPAVEQWLRRVIVTPDFHRVHHSWHLNETNSNYGFNLSLWDHLFGTYVAQPRDGHEGMTIGLHEFRDRRWQRLDNLLRQPFTTPPDASADAGSY